MRCWLKISILLFFLPFSASAAGGLVPCSGPDCDFCDLLQLVVNLINFAIKDIFFPLAGLLVLVGGIMMVTAGAKEENYKKGKEILKNTIIALVIVLCAWILVNALIGVLGGVKIDNFDPAHWSELKC